MDTAQAVSGATSFTRDASQYLTFVLGKEEYAVEILKVQEIKGFSAVTPIPNTPPHIKGVMNLRGTVVPVVSLRNRFGMPESEYNKFSVIIVAMLGRRPIGLVVDAVSDVLDLRADQIEPPPEMGQGVDMTFLRGLAKSGERLLAMLDLEKVVGIAEIKEVAAPAAA